MAEVLRYVDPDAAGAGTGLSWADAYTSLSAWEAAEQTDLVAAGDTHRVLCRASSGTADVTQTTVNGFITDATHYITIEGFDGTYRLIANVGGNSQVLRLDDAYIRVIGLYVENTNPSPTNLDGAIGSLGVSGIEHRVSKCILVGGRYTFAVISGGNCYAWDNFVYGPSGGGGGVITNAAGSNLFASNNTVIGDFYGIRNLAGAITAKNDYAYGTVGAYNGTITKTTCASSDTTGSAGLQSIPYSTATFVNVTAGSEDLHLVSGSALIGVGTSVSGDPAPLNFTDDIDGDTWSTPPSVGADEFITAAGTIVNNTKRIAIHIGLGL